MIDFRQPLSWLFSLYINSDFDENTLVGKEPSINDSCNDNVLTEDNVSIDDLLRSGEPEKVAQAFDLLENGEYDAFVIGLRQIANNVPEDALAILSVAQNSFSLNTFSAIDVALDDVENEEVMAARDMARDSIYNNHDKLCEARRRGPWVGM